MCRYRNLSVCLRAKEEGGSQEQTSLAGEGTPLYYSLIGARMRHIYQWRALKEVHQGDLRIDAHGCSLQHSNPRRQRIHTFEDVNYIQTITIQAQQVQSSNDASDHIEQVLRLGPRLICHVTSKRAIEARVRVCWGSWYSSIVVVPISALRPFE